MGEVNLRLLESAWLFVLDAAGLWALEYVLLGCWNIVELLGLDAEVLSENGFRGMGWRMD